MWITCASINSSDHFYFTNTNERIVVAPAELPDRRHQAFKNSIIFAIAIIMPSKNYHKKQWHK
jgi:hypothetical protein|tara:strand:+ start:561 stop:749 length:189 start_codon:yes stop_codon:yes gene_type:complete